MEPGNHSHFDSSSSLRGVCLFPSKVSLSSWKTTEEASLIGGKLLPGHPAELSDSIKLLLTDAKSYEYEIDPVLKSVH